MDPSAAAISAHIAMLPLANSLFLNWPALVVSWLFISRVLALSESQNAIRELLVVADDGSAGYGADQWQPYPHDNEHAAKEVPTSAFCPRLQ